MPLKRAGLKSSRMAIGHSDFVTKRLEQLRRRRKLISKVRIAKVVSELQIGQLFAAPQTPPEETY